MAFQGDQPAAGKYAAQRPAEYGGCSGPKHDGGDLAAGVEPGLPKAIANRTADAAANVRDLVRECLAFSTQSNNDNLPEHLARDWLPGSRSDPRGWCVQGSGTSPAVLNARLLAQAKNDWHCD